MSRPDNERALAALPSLGPVSARMLVEAGVVDVPTLRRLGSVEAYRRLRFHFGRRATLNFAFALECAVRNLDWRHLEPRRKEELRRAAGQIDASLNLSRSGTSRREVSRD